MERCRVEIEGSVRTKFRETNVVSDLSMTQQRGKTVEQSAP